MKRIIFFLLFFVSFSSYAWDDHFLFSYVALKNFKLVSHQKIITPESLEDFLAKERAGLVTLLQENETWSQQNINAYPPLPETLKFSLNNQSEPLIIQFQKAIRINPTLHYPLFIRYDPFEKSTIKSHTLPKQAVMLDTLLTQPFFTDFKKITGTKVSPFEVITAATGEPDYGMDINLWDNNASEFAKIYHWGDQPFGNKDSPLGTQTPFHLGFYYEPALLYKIAPLFKHSYLEYRVHLFLNLSRFAFQKNHPYWGYRFLGWALHYIQDLTQPYHTSMAPNVSMSKMIMVNILHHLSYETPQQNLIQLITNRHYALENYVYNYVKVKLQNRLWDDKILKALSDESQDKTYPLYNDLYPRAIVARQSNLQNKKTDEAIRHAFPDKYVNDPNYLFGTTEPHINLYALTQKQSNEEISKLNIMLEELLRNFGSHTRNVIRFMLNSVKT